MENRLCRLIAEMRSTAPAVEKVKIESVKYSTKILPCRVYLMSILKKSTITQQTSAKGYDCKMTWTLDKSRWQISPPGGLIC